ncbi:hypothetical protein PPYR_14164 [Photinus pyralis]|uniref:La-related protein 7 n=3 Tax=Photinus pyralis TaxID=7054 RepID=A0A5N4A4F3_PHOPY|nr:la-related protein 7 [Photinus pyralis]KAB0792205.1 hypothetical protein PPYR_14164 [Photinus pyralis]
MDNEHNVDENHENSQKKGRHRKKQLYKSILQQMEFYFSDSNLAKERFLSQLIQNDPYVDVSIFLQFNKIRKLTSSLEDVTKAISKSELIELSEDKTKVRRRLPIKVKENVDECTIYVERLKSDATHEWLTAIFSEFGKVTYVSIPKYYHSNIIKGFAFVEFETEESTNAALAFFESIDCKIPSAMEPEKLCSIATFDEKQQQAKDESVKKRKSSDDAPQIELKKKKSGRDDPAKAEAELVAPVEQDVSESEGEEKKKKKQKKAQKRLTNLKEMGLQVLSKKEWKKMRNRYLEMQRKTMSDLKRHLHKQRVADFHAQKPKPREQPRRDEPPKTVQAFTSGVIVKVALSEPCVESKKLKEELKTNHSNVRYIDIPHAYGSLELYLRFDDSKNAREFCTSGFKDSKCDVLEGEEEQNYWQKIEESRSAKLKNDNRKQRGRDKLLKKAEKQSAKHIRFENSD